MKRWRPGSRRSDLSIGVGASFSVIKLSAGGQTVDVALPRREISTGAGHREFRS